MKGLSQWVRAGACAVLLIVAESASGAGPATQGPAPSAEKPAARATTAPKSGGSTRAATPAGTPAKAATQPAGGSKSKTGAAASKTLPPKVKPKQKPGEVMELDWRDLLPENERAHYSDTAPPPQHGPLGEGGPPAVQKQTTTVNEDVADMMVHLPGFIVPVGDAQKGPITEFFLVPYIGACIHVPPPPPNQMVYVTSQSGIDAESIHEAYWVTGKMRIESRTTALGTAAYGLTATKVERYEY